MSWDNFGIAIWGIVIGIILGCILLIVLIIILIVCLCKCMIRKTRKPPKSVPVIQYNVQHGAVLFVGVDPQNNPPAAYPAQLPTLNEEGFNPASPAYPNYSEPAASSPHRDTMFPAVSKSTPLNQPPPYSP